MVKSFLSGRFPTFSFAVGLVLWGISGSLSLALFIELAGNDSFRVGVSVLWATALEASKILLWRRGGWYRCLSTGLIVVTLTSALGMALWTVEVRQTAVTKQMTERSQEFQDDRRTVEGLQRQIDILVEKLAALPPDYVTASIKLSQEMEVIRDQIRSTQSRILNSSAPHKDGALGPFDAISEFLGIGRKELEIGVIFLVAVLTEACAVALAGQTGPEPREPRLRSIPKTTTPREYLNVALDHPKSPKLLGRLEVARRMEITESEAKGHLKNLVRDGQVVRIGRSFVAREAIVTSKERTSRKSSKSHF